jgi:hypothetical protein
MEMVAELAGKKVTVHSLIGDVERQDVGVLEAAQGHWVKLRKTTNEVIYFSIFNVRIIKPFDSA